MKYCKLYISLNKYVVVVVVVVVVALFGVLYSPMYIDFIQLI